MFRSIVRSLFIAGFPLLLVSCAAGTLVPDQQSMPAARASLRPEYRIFYDSLIDYGQWVLIEPYGYVFRPSVNYLQWRPYDRGFWVPTDLYGWVWVSSEPFGWATYHYGSWVNDDYQGWVWVPGTDWGPAWVTWTGNDQYVGWAPDLAGGSLPGGGYTYVPIGQLSSTDRSGRVTDAAKIAPKIANARPINNNVEVDGVRINRGPDFKLVEQSAGPLQLVKVEDLITPGDLTPENQKGAGQQLGLGDRGRSNGLPSARTGAPEGTLRPIASADSTRRAAAAATREVGKMLQRGTVEPRIPLVRPFGVPQGPKSKDGGIGSKNQ